MAFKKVEIGPEEIGEYWKPEKKGDEIEGHIFEFYEDEYQGKKQVRINLYLGRDDNDEAIMTLLPAHAHLKRYYVNLQEGDYIKVTVTDKIENGKYTKFEYDVLVDPDRKVVWPKENDDEYYAEE